MILLPCGFIVRAFWSHGGCQVISNALLPSCETEASALGEYIPQAPVSDEAKKHNQNLPGMGGVFNAVNLSLYHYAANNPVKYVDPNGEVAVAVPVVLGLIALYAVLKIYNDNSNSFWSNSSSRGIIGDGLSENADFAKNKSGNSAKTSPMPKSGAAAAAGSPMPPDDWDDDDDEYEYTQRIGRCNGKTPRNNQVQNKQVDDISRRYGLTKDEQKKLHNEISHQGYDYSEVEKIAEQIVKERK